MSVDVLHRFRSRWTLGAPTPVATSGERERAEARTTTGVTQWGLASAMQ